MKQIVYVHDLYVNRIKISSISHDVHFLYLIWDDMDLVGNDMD